MKLHLLHKELLGNIHISYYKDTHFLKLWHYHPQHELVFIENGEGMLYTGDYTGVFQSGDLFYIGGNVPHMFHSVQSSPDAFCSAYVVHIEDAFFKSVNLQATEFSYLKTLLEEAVKGVRFSGFNSELLVSELKAMTQQAIAYKTLRFLYLLLTVNETSLSTTLATTQWLQTYNNTDKRLHTVVQYIMQNFQQNISLDEIAEISGMNKASFCRYFKNKTHKSFVEYVNELRVNYACNLLKNTTSDKSITDICFESGFNSMSYFSRTFKSTMQQSPTTYRERFTVASL